jgi:hypothetical protein
MTALAEISPPIQEDDPLHSPGRRVVIKGLAAVGLMAATYDSVELPLRYLEEKHWPHNEPSFTWLGGEAYTGQEEISIYLPGFGEMEPEENAETWKRNTPNLGDTLMGYMDYSNEGASIDKMVELIRAQIDTNRTKSVNFVCRSIGGLYMTEVAIRLGLPVHNIYLISSPPDLDDGNYGSSGEFAARAPKSPTIATIAKFAVNVCISVRDHGFSIKSPLRNVIDGFHSAEHGASPIALQEEVKEASGINLKSKTLQDRVQKSGVFNKKSTKVHYIAAADHYTDHTVYINKSINGFRDFFGPLDIPFEVIDADYSGHANVQQSAKAMAKRKRKTDPSVSLAFTPK